MWRLPCATAPVRRHKRQDRPRGWNEFTARHPSRGCLPTDTAHRQDAVRSFRTEIEVEQLTLDEAQRVLAETQAELRRAFNSAHATMLRQVIAEVEDQIEWLQAQQHAEAMAEAAAEHTYDVFTDQQTRVPT